MSEIIDSNKRYWTGQPLSGIVHGISIDIDLICEYFPKIERDDSGKFWPWFYELFELGAGNCDLASRLASLKYFQVRALDLNPEIASVEQVLVDDSARLTVLSGHTGDVTKWGEGIGNESILNLERVDGIVVQALLPSLLGDNGNEWKNLLDAAAMWLAPDKYIFINDFRRGDYFYTPLAKMYGSAEWRRQMKMWKKRYENNVKAFEGLGISPRMFLVGKPGTDGKILENGDVNQLRELYARKDCTERFAQHVDPNELNLYMRRLGFSLVYEKYGGYRSRGNADLIAPTDLQIWQKSSKFQYHYLAKGLDIRDPKWEHIALDRMHQLQDRCKEQNLKYFWQALDMTARLAPHSQIQSILRLRDQIS